MTVEPTSDADVKVSTASSDEPKQQQQQQQQQQSPQQQLTTSQSAAFQLPNFSVPPPKLNFPPPKAGQPPLGSVPANAARSYYFRPQAPRSGPMSGQQPNVPANALSVPNSNNAMLTNPDDFDGKRLRKSVMRKTVDYNSSIVRCLENRIWQRDWRDRRALQPDVLYYPDLMPPPSYIDNPTNAITTRFVKTATNKIRCPIFCMAWTPEGRRLITGASSGEFTLWNGLTFNFETILQAHDAPVRAMVWSHNDNWMVTGDHTGYVKYWQSNMNNVKMFMAHKEALRGLSFSPSDTKFVTCSDDGTLRIWDFLTCNEERVLRGHGADVKCTQWHPQKALIASGSKDNQQPIKLWDPRTGKAVTTIHAHKATVMDLKWNANGNWLVTASRDHLLKLFDLRKLREEMQTFRGHKKEASVVAWHPVHEGLFTSGGSDGSIMFWQVDCNKELGAIEQAHDSIVWTMAWHPLGHILCTGSNDHTSKFWTRNRPGDTMRDKYNMNMQTSGVTVPGVGPIDDMVGGSMDDDGYESRKLIPGMDAAAARRNEDGGHDRDSSERSYRSDDDYDDDDHNYRSRKMPYCKPIPRNFLANWNDTRNCGPLSDIMLKDRHCNGIRLLPNPDIMPANELQPTQVIVYGTKIRVYPNSRLCKAIQDGADSLIKMLLSGDIDEVTHLLPFPDSPNEISCRRNKVMMAAAPPPAPHPLPPQPQPSSSSADDSSNPWAIKPPLNFVGGVAGQSTTGSSGNGAPSAAIEEDFRLKGNFHAPANYQRGAVSGPPSFTPFPFPAGAAAGAGAGNVPNAPHQLQPSNRQHHHPY